jgi:tetratricopeptide (TPR) repeat protein
LIEKSIAFWESVEDAFCEELGVSYNTFGYIFHIENKIDDSLIFYKKALACKLKAYGEQNVAIANALNNIGDVSLHLDNATAANYYQKAKNIYMAVQGETHPNVAKMDISIACALNNMDLYEIAKQHLKDAFEILVPLSHPEIERASIIANAVYYVGKYKMPIKDWIASLLPKGYGIQLSEVDTNDLLKKPW